MLAAASDDATAWVRSGFATQRAMLAASARGLGVGVLGQLVADPEARGRAGAALGLDGSTVQQALRIGQRGADGSPGRTPRRALRHVIA